MITDARLAAMTMYMSEEGPEGMGCPTDTDSDPPQPTCNITSQTVATSPADRTRTRIGVGEEIELTYSRGSANWSKSGAGRLSRRTGSSITFTAGDHAGTVVITAQGADCTATITLTVVAPSRFTMTRKRGTGLQHRHNRPDCGWRASVCVHPNDVNFYRLEIRETDSQVVVSGSYSVFSGQSHGGYTIAGNTPGLMVSNWFPLVRHTDRLGSVTGPNFQDRIYSGDPDVFTGAIVPGSGVPYVVGQAPPFNAGTMSMPIVWQWRVVAGSNIRDFPRAQQAHNITPQGRCNSNKAGHREHCIWDDATSVP